MIVLALAPAPAAALDPHASVDLEAVEALPPRIAVGVEQLDRRAKLVVVLFEVRPAVDALDTESSSCGIVIDIVGIAERRQLLGAAGVGVGAVEVIAVVEEPLPSGTCSGWSRTASGKMYVCVAVALGRSDAPVVTQRTPTEVRPRCSSHRLRVDPDRERRCARGGDLRPVDARVRAVDRAAHRERGARSGDGEVKGAAKPLGSNGRRRPDIAAAPLAVPGVGVASTANSGVPCTRP